jgi:hypothetical protein
MKIGDTRCRELKVDVKGVESSWWIDLESGRVVRSTFRGRQMDFSDFRTVGEIEVPFEIVTRFENQVISRASIANYDINPPIDVALLFRTPDLWLARFSLPERKRNPYSSYSRYSSYPGSSYSSYSGYAYRPPRVTTRDPGTVIWDSRASLVH